ncbi:hypothetical protein JCM39194_24060 [Desulfotomaculum varum]
MANDREEKQLQQDRELLTQPSDAISQGLDEAMFKLLHLQAQHGADHYTTLIMLSLMNLLGIVNCLNRILPEKQQVSGTREMAAQLAGLLGGAMPPQGAAAAASGPGGIDPSLLASLASLLGPPRGAEATAEMSGKPGLDPAMLAALAGLMGGPAAGAANPAALMALLANLLGPKRPPEGQRVKEREERKEPPKDPPAEKPSQGQDNTRKEQALPHRGILKWDPRLGAPTSSF